MRKIFHSISLIVLFIFSYSAIKAQCKEYNENNCKKTLAPYVNYGNLISTVLGSGEYAELNITFFSKTDYRIAICGLENVPNLEFRVFDSEHNLLFKSKDKFFTRTWDFNLEQSQQLIIAIIVPETKTEISGCVAILNGMMIKEK